jgi:hypothetical protein
LAGQLAGSGRLAGRLAGRQINRDLDTHEHKQTYAARKLTGRKNWQQGTQQIR